MIKIHTIELIEQELYLFESSSRYGYNIDVIVMHPQTWENLCEENSVGDFMLINRYSNELKYKGIDVIRSLDLEENKFKFTLKF